MTGYSEVAQKAKQDGVKYLSDAELLTLIIRNGGKHQPYMVSENLTHEQGLYNNVARAKYVGELNAIAAGMLTKQQELSLLSAIEMSRRLASCTTADKVHISSPGIAAGYMMPKLRYETHEYFVVMMLNTKNRIIDIMTVAEGSLTSAVVHPREVYSQAVVRHAAVIIAFHNHPSGDPYPSSEDRKLTESLDKAGEVLGIPLMDHIVIGDGKYYSFKEHGDL